MRVGVLAALNSADYARSLPNISLAQKIAIGKYGAMIATAETERKAPWEMGAEERSAGAAVMDELASFASNSFTAEICGSAVIDATGCRCPVPARVARETAASRNSGGGIADESPRTVSRMKPGLVREIADQYDSRCTSLACNNIVGRRATLQAAHHLVLKWCALGLPEGASAWAHCRRASAPRSRSYGNYCSIRLNVFGPNVQAHFAEICLK